jgi:hypothetical protein
LGKAWKKFADFEVAFSDAATVDSTCNQEQATTCIATWMRTNFRHGHFHNNYQKRQCLVAAGCQMAGDKFTSAQESAFKTKARQAFGDVKTSYREVWNYTRQELRKGAIAHKARQAQINADFQTAAKQFAGDMGCNVQCLASCSSSTRGCLKQCQCGQGVINVKPVNVAAVVESIYGDAENLSEEQLAEIDWAIVHKNNFEQEADAPEASNLFHYGHGYNPLNCRLGYAYNAYYNRCVKIGFVAKEESEKEGSELYYHNPLQCPIGYAYNAFYGRCVRFGVNVEDADKS